jgi:protein phosphatase
MGGANSGEFASRITVDKITKLMPRGYRAAAPGLASGFDATLAGLFQAIHYDLLKLGQSYEECRGMGTTLSLCWLTPGWLYFGHIGDSRIYHLPAPGGLHQLSHDHSHVGWLRRKGELNERDARHHPRRNVLHQALGAGHQFIEPQFGVLPCAPGDRFLICSDGLTEGLWDSDLDQIVRAPGGGPVAQRLITAALERAGKDNITALVSRPSRHEHGFRVRHAQARRLQPCFPEQPAVSRRRAHGGWLHALFARRLPGHGVRPG